MKRLVPFVLTGLISSILTLVVVLFAPLVAAHLKGLFRSVS